jgi:uncharacterized protein (DUF4415 family)
MGVSELSPQGRPIKKKEKYMKNKKIKLKEKSIKELLAMKDSEIDYSDIPELNENFWKNAKLFKPVDKKMISLRIDKDVLDWFKAQGKGYQSYMNAILKSYVASTN